MYFGDRLTYYHAIIPFQSQFYSLISPSQQVLSSMKASSLVTELIDRVQYCIQIQTKKAEHRLALILVSFNKFVEKMRIKLERSSFQSTRLRIFFSFNNEGIQKDQYRNMLNFFKSNDLALIEYNKRKQLLVKFNIGDQTFAQFLQLLNKKVPMLELIQQNSTIEWLIKNKKLGAQVCNGFYAHNIRERTYLVFTEHFKKEASTMRMKIVKKGQHFKVAQLLNYAVRQNYNIEIAMEIGQKIDFYLDFKINEGSKESQIEKFKEILRLIEASKIHLIYPIVSTSLKNNQNEIKTFYIQAKTLEDIRQFILFSYYANTDTSPLTRQDYLNRKQSIHYAKRQYHEYSMEAVSQLTSEYSRGNLLFLKPYWDSGLLNFLEEVYQRWEDYKDYHWVEMCKFIRLLDYKSYQIQEKYSIFYPKSLKIIAKFMQKLGMRTIAAIIKERISKKRAALKQDREKIENEVLGDMMDYLKIQEHVIDQIVRYLIKVQHPDKKDEKFKLSISNELLKGKPVNFSNLIAVIEQFQDETSKWQDALHLVFKEIYKITTVSKTIPNPCIKEPITQNNTQKTKKVLNQEAYLQKIENEKLIKLNCLGCSQHFIYNMNIKDNSINATKLVVFQKAELINESPLQVKLSICGFLNSLEGGVMLFGCERKYLDINAQGSVISQTMKKEFSQLINNFCLSFHPLLEEGSVIVNFVPIIANPYLIDPFEDRWLTYDGTMAELKSKKYIRRKYYEGTYVMRIIVRPSRQGIIYYFQHDNQYRIGLFEGQRIIEAPISQLRKKIKSKYKNYIDSQLSIQTTNILKIPSLSHHKCDTPEQGLKVTVKYDEVPQDTLNNWQTKFKFTTHVVSKRKYLLIMRDNLRQMGYRCQVQRKFLQYGFRSATNSAIIYHDNEFSQLSYLVKSSQYFSRISVEIEVFEIKICVKVWRNGGKVISQADQRKLKKWFNAEFPSSILTASESVVEKEKTVSYLKGESKIESFFIFLLLRNFNENAVMEDESNNIPWKTSKESIFFQTNQFKSKLCGQSRGIYDIMNDRASKDPLINVNHSSEQIWVRKLLCSLVNEDSLTTWQRELEQGYREDFIINATQKLAESRQFVKYLGRKITTFWKQMKNTKIIENNLQVIGSFWNFQEEKQVYGIQYYSSEPLIGPLQIAEEVQEIEKIEAYNERKLTTLIELTSRRHSKMLQRVFESYIPQFCIENIAEQKFAWQFSKIVFYDRTIEQYMKLNSQLESIFSQGSSEIENINYQQIKQGYSQIIIYQLLKWTKRFEQIENCEIIGLLQRLIQDKALLTHLLEFLQRKAQRFYREWQKQQFKGYIHTVLKSIQFLFSTRIFASCQNELLTTRANVKNFIDKLQFLQEKEDNYQFVERQSLESLTILIQKQLQRSQEKSMIRIGLQQWIQSLQNKQYGWMVANAHYVSQLLSKIKSKGQEYSDQKQKIVGYLLEFVDFVTKQIAKISFKKIQEYCWLFNLLKNIWLFHQLKGLNKHLNEKIDNFDIDLQRNFLKIIDQSLLRTSYNSNHHQLLNFVYVLQKARQLLPPQKFIQFSNYKKEQVCIILLRKINFYNVALQRFCSGDKRSQQVSSTLANVLSSSEFVLYIRHFLVIDAEQIKQRYHLALSVLNQQRQSSFKKQMDITKEYSRYDNQITVKIKKGEHEQTEIVVYSKSKKCSQGLRTNKQKNRINFKRLKRKEIDQFLSLLDIEQLNNKLYYFCCEQKNIFSQRDFISTLFSEQMEDNIYSLTEKWLLFKLRMSNNDDLQQPQRSRITVSQIKIHMNFSCNQGQSSFLDNQKIQMQIRETHQKVILFIFDLYVNEYRLITAKHEYNQIVNKQLFKECYNFFQSLKQNKSFLLIILEKYYVKRAQKEIIQMNKRIKNFPQEDFIGLDPVQCFNKLERFLEQNKAALKSTDNYVLTVQASRDIEILNSNHVSMFQKIYESIFSKNYDSQSESNNHIIAFLVQLKQIAQKMQINRQNVPKISEINQKTVKNVNKIIKNVNDFILQVEDQNQIVYQLLKFMKGLEFVRGFEHLEYCHKNLMKVDSVAVINKVITQIRAIHVKATKESEKIFDSGFESEHFKTISIIIDFVKRSQCTFEKLKEQCDWLEKKLASNIQEIITNEINKIRSSFLDLKQKMKKINDLEPLYLGYLEQDIKQLELKIIKIVKLKNVPSEQGQQCDLKVRSYLAEISQWKMMLQENQQYWNYIERFDENQVDTMFDIQQNAFRQAIKTYQEYCRQELYDKLSSFYCRLLQDFKQYPITIQQKMKLLGNIIAVYNMTHQQLRAFRINYVIGFSVQTSMISEKWRQKLCKIALMLYQNKDISSLFVVNESLQNRVRAMGIISIYLAITTQKQVCIACSPFFANKSQQLFQQVLKNSGLQSKVNFFTYKEALVDALTPIISKTNEEMEKLFKFKDKDMQKIMIERKGDEQISFPKINKKILMIDQASIFFDFLKSQNTFVQTMNIADPLLQSFMKMILKIKNSQKISFTNILMQKQAENLFEQHPIFDKIMIQQTKKIIRDAKDYNSSYQIIKGRLIHEDCNGRLNEGLHYGYKTIFNNLVEFQANKIASVHKKGAIRMELVLNSFDLLALNMYFERMYGFVEYQDSLSSPTVQYFLQLYKIQNNTIDQASNSESNNSANNRDLLMENVMDANESLQRVVYLVQQASNHPRIVILKDNKQIQELTRLKQFASISRQSWILKSTKDIQWPFYQQNQKLSKKIVITNQECFKFILKDMLIHHWQEYQAKNAIIFCSFKPTQLHPYIHMKQYTSKVVLIETKDILEQQDYRDFLEQKCLESLKKRENTSQSLIETSISRYRFVSNILALNMIQSRLLKSHKIIICINGNSHSLRLFDFRLLIHKLYQSAGKIFNLFTKIIVFRGTNEGNGKCRYVQTPFNDDPNPLLYFLKDFEPNGTFDPADTHDMLNKLQSDHEQCFVFVESIEKKIENASQQKVKLLQMPYRKKDQSQGQKLFDLYKKNQEKITDLIQKEIGLKG